MNYASVKQRFLATALDLLIVFAFLSLISILFRETAVHVNLLLLFEKIWTMDAPFAYFVSMLYDISTGAGVVTGVLQILFLILYLIILPIVWPRQTIGRSIFFVKLVRLNGQRLTFGTLIIRELMAKLLLLIFSLGITFWINIYLILKTPGGRSIHDRMANTLVISCKSED